MGERTEFDQLSPPERVAVVKAELRRRSLPSPATLSQYDQWATAVCDPSIGTAGADEATASFVDYLDALADEDEAERARNQGRQFLGVLGELLDG